MKLGEVKGRMLCYMYFEMNISLSNNDYSINNLRPTRLHNQALSRYCPLTSPNFINFLNFSNTLP